MSFSSDTKKELYEKIPSGRHCRIAELLAVYRYEAGRGRNIAGIDDNTADVGENRKLSYIEERHMEHIRVLTEKLEKKLEGAIPEFDRTVIYKDCCKRSFLRGAFLAAGSVTDPSKSYHLEIVCGLEADADLVSELMSFYGLKSGITLRNGSFVVYIKEGDAISDLLGLLDAPKAMMTMENARIIKEMRNNINRQVNCETANLTKVVNAAVRQEAAIRYLIENGLFERLPENLRIIAELRLENTDMSLTELGEMLAPPVGKSGVNHRLRRIMDFAEKNGFS
ncbi:MAG: DNA-binding protein WhiA [Lachnospiraceae bacterium]|nr:DNA-binding protein WhiA [Lachnospiraceae bacterium]